MVWLAAGVLVVALGILARRFRSAWMRPWRDLEHVVGDVKDGRAPRTFLVDGNPFAHRIGIALEDVFLRQRELVSQAEEGELNVRTILGAMRDGLAVIDRERRVRMLNPAARQMFGISDARSDATVLEMFRDTVVAEAAASTLRTGATVTNSVNVRRAGSPAARRIDLTSLPMRNDDGATRGAVLLFHDVTQLQQLEQVRREFVSNVSHELRTPLSIFRGYLETLLDEPELPADERERILRVLEKHSARLHSLVDDLLSLARLEAPQPHLELRPVALDELLERIARDWTRRLADKQLPFVLDLAEDLPRIDADEARLEEVIHNLLENAAKYSDAGAQITVAAHTAGADRVVISVADTGTGIAASDLPRIFERFYRADKARSREHGGTGLGLAIVKHIAQLHGGTVEAESQLGRGTTIRVLLPRHRRAE